MKQSQTITELALFDVVPVVFGVAADVSHGTSTQPATLDEQIGLGPDRG